MREGQSNDLIVRLAADARLGLDRASLDALLDEPMAFTGDAAGQVARVVSKAEQVAHDHPEAATYSPGAIL
jgi:adenylosuccinate lyase